MMNICMRILLLSFIFNLSSCGNKVPLRLPDNPETFFSYYERN